MSRPTQEQLKVFLQEVDRDFPVPLSQKQELSAFAEKLLEKGTLCCVWENGRLTALAAGYTQHLQDRLAYLSIAAVSRTSRGKGLGRRVVADFLEESRRAGARAVHLYAVPTNRAAMAMYQSLGFRPWTLEAEPRPHDAHLIFDLE